MTLRRMLSATLVLAVLAALAPSAGAQPRERGDRGRARGWHGDIRNFHERDFSRWRGGRWFHGTHNGHLGWWWIVAGVYYFYPRAVYPYPDPYTPPVVIVQPPAGGAAPGQPAQAPAGTWYYCDAARGYYPYVAECPGGWRAVSAQPPVASQQPAAPQPQMPAPPPSQPAQPSAGSWYYCDSAKGYYPYVAECPGGWRAVPASPNPAPPR